MSQTLRIRTERPFIPEGRVASSLVGTSPGFSRGATFSGWSAPSRREALQQFHRLEMMVEVDGCMQAESGLVLSDEGDETDAGELRVESDVRGALREAREELAGRALNMSSCLAENVWQEARREARLDVGDALVEDSGVLPLRQHIPAGGCDVLESDIHKSIMDDLGNLQFRMEKIRTRQQNRLCRTHVAAGSDGGVLSAGEVSLSSSSNGESEFDPDRYIKPLLCPVEAANGADIFLQQQQQQVWQSVGGDEGAVHTSALRNILPDDASVQEALRLLQYNVRSDHPDVVACVQRCRDDLREKQQQYHVAASVTPLAGQKRDRSPAVEKPTVNLPPCRTVDEEPPSVAQLAALVAKTLPEIPEDLRRELSDQRRLLERLAAAQEESIRQHAREKQEATRRRIMASRADPTLGFLAPSTVRESEPYELAEALQNVKKDSKRPLPPVITITTMQPKQPPHLLQPAPVPPHYIQDELERLHRQYERLLRDERRAWTDIMQKQKEAFEREKVATVEVLRNVAGIQQRENTEEIKRAISASEIKRQRWQHAAEVKQQLALQQMLHTAIPSGIAVTATERSHRRSPFLPPHSSGKTPNKPNSLPRAPRSRGGKTTAGKEKTGGGQRHTAVKGPYSVVLPPESGEMAHPSALEAATEDPREEVEEVVVLSDGEKQYETKPFPHHVTVSGARIYGSRRPTTKPSSSSSSPLLSQPPAGRRLVARATQRSPYASPARRTAVTPVGASSQRVRISDRGKGKLHQQRGDGKKKNDGVSPNAFSVKDACAPARVFDATIETPLAASSCSYDANAPRRRSAECSFTKVYDNSDAASIPTAAVSSATAGVSSRCKSEATLLHSVVILADILTTEECAKRQELEECVLDTMQPSAPPMKQVSGGGEGLQQSCDVHYFGEERGVLTPRRRAKLRAAEAQSLIEGRHRLERIKALSLSSPGQQFGAPPLEHRQLENVLVNETIHCIIGDMAERDLFADLMQELARELLKAELHRIAFNGMGKNKKSDHVEEMGSDKEGNEDIDDAMEIKQLIGTMGSRFGVVHDELSLEQTVLRHVEDALLQSLAHHTSELEKKGVVDEGAVACVESAADAADAAAAAAAAAVGVAADADADAHAAASSTGMMLLGPPPLVTPEGDAEVEKQTTWVREVVRASSDVLWRAPDERDVSCELPPSAQEEAGEMQKQRHGLVGGESLRLPPATSEPGVLVEVNGATGSTVRGDGGVLRIVLDVAPMVQQFAAAVLPLRSRSRSPPPPQQQQQPTWRGATAIEDRRLLYAAEEDLHLCEVVDAPRTWGSRATTEAPVAIKRTLEGAGASISPALQTKVNAYGIGGANVSLARDDPEVMQVDVLPRFPGVLQVQCPAAENAAHPTAPADEQQRLRDKEYLRERHRCQEDEALQRQMLQEQEDTLRTSWCMMWDWQRLNFAALQRKQHEQQQGTEMSRFAATTIAPTQTPPPPPPPPLLSSSSSMVFAAQRNGNNEVSALPAVSPCRGIRDPVTRFIFEWMHEYSETKGEQLLAQRSFVDRLHEANFVADGVSPCRAEPVAAAPAAPITGDATTETDVCRRLLMDMDNTDSSSWLSSTNPSSMTDGGLPRFATYLQRSSAGAHPQRMYRSAGENPSSATTETTYYSSQSSLILDAHRRNRSPPPACPSQRVDRKSSTTITTSSTSRTWTSSDSSEKPRLRDTLLRHLRETHPQEQHWQHQQYTVEELRQQVEILQDAAQRAAANDARLSGFAGEQLQHTGPPVVSLPLPPRPFQ